MTNSSKAFRPATFVGLFVALLVLAQPLWLYPALRILSPSHALTHGRDVASGLVDPTQSSP